MNGNESDLLSHLMETFQAEARDHIGAITARLMEVERPLPPEQLDRALETIYRSAHSLKGGARIVNLTLVEFLCQSLEDRLADLRNGEQPLTPPLLDLLHEATGTIEKILAVPHPDAPPTALKSAAIRIRRQLDESPQREKGVSTAADSSPPRQPFPLPLAEEPSSEASPAERPPQAPATNRSARSETVRVPAARLDGLMLQAEELIALKLALQEQLRGLREASDRLALLRLPLTRIDSLDREGIRELGRDLAAIDGNLALVWQRGENDSRTASAMLDNLIGNARELLLFPLSSLTDGFARLVRDMAREQSKEIELRLEGGEIELDRRILQELKDPLVHLLRNSIDHGIELACQRRAAGKPERALISIGAICIDSGKVEIRVRDDGRGIDIAAIRDAALRRGMITPEEGRALGREETLALIFRSGFSSREEVSIISGRGLGLAIVAERVEKLGGTISVESAPGSGTCFRLLIPLSLATFRGIHLRVGERLFAIPTLNVLRVCRMAPGELIMVGNRETLLVEGQNVPVVALASILALPGDGKDATERRTLMLLGSERELAALEVDEVLGEDDLLVKELGPQLVRVPHISGATVLGNGAVVPILNAHDLLTSALGHQGHQPQPAAKAVERRPSTRSILVVDDSITSRTLLKNVLESCGYRVATAVDGFDALALLQEGSFDLVSSDVEMPRMDGFELTARIRADQRFSRLPVILVTSMDSPEDRRKGINAGADAYIVKSSFDQSNLLDTIRKLIQIGGGAS
jgi:two-component system chemotaxis sensor kinase CheA